VREKGSFTPLTLDLSFRIRKSPGKKTIPGYAALQYSPSVALHLLWMVWTELGWRLSTLGWEGQGVLWMCLY